MNSNNLYKHMVDLYDNNPVTRKEYFTFLCIFLLPVLIINIINFINKNIANPLFVTYIIIFIVFLYPLLLYITFKKLIKSFIPVLSAFLLSFLIPYVLIIYNMMYAVYEGALSDIKYANITFILYHFILLISWFILPDSNENQKKLDINKKLQFIMENLIKPFNYIFTFNLKAAINRKQYVLSTIIVCITPVLAAYTAYLLAGYYEFFSAYNSETNSIGIFPSTFSYELLSSLMSILISFTYSLFLLILRFNDITKNLILKFSIITAYFILIAIVRVTEMKGCILIPVFTILLFIIPVFIKGKSAKEETI